MEKPTIWITITYPDGRKELYEDGNLISVLYPPKEGGSW